MNCEEDPSFFTRHGEGEYEATSAERVEKIRHRWRTDGGWVDPAFAFGDVKFLCSLLDQFLEPAECREQAEKGE